MAGLQEAARPSVEAFCEARRMLGQTHLLQDTYADLLFLIQRVSHKPHDAPSLAQHRLLANPHKWLAYKRPPDPPWKPFARHGACSDKQTCCAARYLCGFALFDAKGVPLHLFRCEEGSAEWAVPVGARSRAVMFHSGVPNWYTGFHTLCYTLLRGCAADSEVSP